MITMESIKEKLGFDPIDYFSTPIESNLDPYKVDDSKPSVWAVLSLEEIEWLFPRLREAGVL